MEVVAEFINALSRLNISGDGAVFAQNFTNFMQKASPSPTVPLIVQSVKFSEALRRLSSRFNRIGGLPRGDKGRIETSLVPPWRVIEKELSHLINLLTPT